MAAPHQPPATPNTLSTIPDDLALSILVRVPCKEDRASMSLVCKAWRAMITRLSARATSPPLPWLLLPSRFRDDPAVRAACVLSGCCVHPNHIHNPLTILPPGARFVGSYDGAWIFLHYGGPMRAHGLLNLRTGQARALPSSFRRWDDLYLYYLNSMFILAATLSSSPDDPNCIGAAIVVAWRDPDPYAMAAPLPPLRRFLAFWRMGWAVADEIVVGGAANVYHVEDVVHHDGAFNVLVNYGDHILRCTEAAHVHQGTWGWWMTSELLRFRPGERIHDDQFMRARYIVVSRGELLKVMRWKPHRNQPTSMFKVFRATKRPQNPDEANAGADADSDFPVAEFPWEWSELDTLDGRILFVGYGCSRSYDADKYPGFKAGIYFLDDGKFYDEAVFFHNHSLRPYPCSDNGKYSEGRAQPCFPTTDRSDHSSPAWLLP